jgi:hypothetical protein
MAFINGAPKQIRVNRSRYSMITSVFNFMNQD